ncbi:MAG: hypothetical protein JNK72_11035 [Myxococcales bacterium]|nr:hypothetical protein [Myxococcales bacterium]
MRPGVTRWLVVVPLLVLSTLGAALGDIMGVSGLVASHHPDALLLVWLVEALLAVLAAGLVAERIDRYDRVSFARSSAGAAALCALVGAWVFLRPSPNPAALLALAVVERLQSCVLYAVVWALARDVFGARVAAFVKLRVVSTLGGLGGAGLATLGASAAVARSTLFLGLALAFVLAALTLGAATKRLGPEAAALRVVRRDEGAAAPSLRSAVVAVRAHAALRALSGLGVMNGAAYTVFTFLVAQSLGAQAGAGADTVQRWYSALRGLEPLAYAGTELLAAGWVIARLGLTRSLTVTPWVLLAINLAVARAPTPRTTFVTSALLQAAFAIEGPALAARLAALPTALRGRLGVLLDGTPYSVGYIVGVGLLGLVRLFEVRAAGAEWGALPTLGLALLCGLAGLRFAARLRASASHEPT